MSKGIWGRFSNWVNKFSKWVFRKKGRVWKYFLFLIVLFFGLFSSVIFLSNKITEKRDLELAYNAKLDAYNSSANNYSSLRKDAVNKKIDVLLKEDADNDQTKYAKFLVTEGMVYDISSELFKVMYTWDSGADYETRGERVATYLDSSIIENSGYFEKGIDVTGNSMIDALNLKSEFKDLKVFVGSSSLESLTDISAMVVVSFESREGENAAGTSDILYSLKYNVQEKKITELQKVSKLSALPAKQADYLLE